MTRSEGSAARSAPLLLLLLPLLGWWTLRIGSGAVSWSFPDYANLAFHEAGHLVFRPFGSTTTYLGGTLLQLFVPAGLGAWLLLREGRPPGSAVCLWWLGQSLVNVARYMADARDLELPLVGGGDHDWNELFYRFGLLSEGSVTAVASATRRVGILGMLLGLAWILLLVAPAPFRERLVSRHPSLSRIVG